MNEDTSKTKLREHYEKLWEDCHELRAEHKALKEKHRDLENDYEILRTDWLDLMATLTGMGHFDFT